MLRQLRGRARLTQEELAEAAGLSQRAVSDLERGIHRTAHKDTAVLLADALGVAGPVRELFVAAARGRVGAGEVLAAGADASAVTAVPAGAESAAAASMVPLLQLNNLPAQLSSFIGREAELAEVRHLVDGARLVTLTWDGPAAEVVGRVCLAA